jgi:hypothetical protein
MRRAKQLVSLGAALVFAFPVHAVEYNINDGTYVTTPPDDVASGYSVAGWDSGWSGSGVTGWNYVGQIGSASGVYLGDGYVLTAGHVGAGNFTLGGVTYDEVAGSVQSIGTADLTLFQISTSPDLPSLTLALNPPTIVHGRSPGSAVVMIGYGGGYGETWGENHVTEINQSAVVYSFVSNDFYTMNGTYNYHGGSVTNTAQLVSGDSGGGDFIYNSTTGQWELAGINEAQLIDDTTGDIVGSAMIQLSSYDSLISTDMSAEATPEPPTWILVGFALFAAKGWSRWRERYARVP